MAGSLSLLGGLWFAGALGVTRPSPIVELENLNVSRAAAATAIVTKANKVLFQNSYGYFDSARIHPTASNTVFNVASVSKQFTAAAVQLLIQRGQVKASDSVLKYYPEFPQALEAITVHHLIHHTSGLSEYTDQICVGAADVLNSQVIEYVRTNPKLSFQPGSQFEYSNTGYALLATLVERVTLQKFPEFLQENIFAPAGLKDTQVLTHEAYQNHTRRAVSRGPAPDYTLADADPCNYIYGDGTLGVTQEDYPKWATALFDEKIWNAKSLSEIFKSDILTDGTSTQYAHGWFVSQGAQGLVATHTGGWLGYRSFSYVVPKTGLVIFLAATSESVPIFELADELVAKFDGP